MSKRQLILLILAIIAGGLAMFFTRIHLIRQQQIIQTQTREELARAQEMQAAVLVAARDIPKGTSIEAGMLESKIIPKEYLQPQVVSYPERIIGMVTLVPMSKGEQVTLNRLTSSKQASASSLAMATPVGKRAVTIQVDNISSLLGMIRPGDYVDVISFIPMHGQGPDGKPAVQLGVISLFQNVLVLAVGRDIGAQSPSQDSRYKKEGESGGGSSPLITLALTPQEASLIAFVQEQGKIRLALRSPADSRIEPVQPASWDAVFQYLMPQMPPSETQGSVAEEISKQLPKEKPREVEIYRGLKKEIVPLSK